MSWLGLQILDKGWWAVGVAESPPSPLHPALLLNANWGWASVSFILLIGISVTNIWSGWLAVSLCLVGKGLGNNHSRMVLFVDTSGICKFYSARWSLLPISNWTRQPHRDPALLACMIQQGAHLKKQKALKAWVWSRGLPATLQIPTSHLFHWWTMSLLLLNWFRGCSNAYALFLFFTFSFW